MFRYHAILPFSQRHQLAEYDPFTAELVRLCRYASFTYSDHSPDLVLNSLPGVRWWRVTVRDNLVVAASDPAVPIGVPFVFDWPAAARNQSKDQP